MQLSPPEPRRLVASISEACDALRVKRSTIYKLINDEKIRVVKLGTRTLIPWSELERLCAP